MWLEGTVQLEVAGAVKSGFYPKAQGSFSFLLLFHGGVDAS